ncbi:hypothetical protein [Natrarchaeobius chitinivorans]|uniref:Uncharacterized protein n=1 Tax=Natrarchaeobius chitinivorans TaxID=1679083 RepID=A0A3N6M1K8_NATCH|nr:hypothetical protein [Natrarchaeobius chitinivorans]RQG97213.1 hypothetical protein EA473_03845 [Natrarchaeobius chitinivorans]
MQLLTKLDGLEEPPSESAETFETDACGFDDGLEEGACYGLLSVDSDTARAAIASVDRHGTSPWGIRTDRRSDRTRKPTTGRQANRQER